LERTQSGVRHELRVGEQTVQRRGLLLQSCRVAPDQGHAGALARQRRCDGCTDTPTGSGDDGNFAC
jgi:hypothetical protein